MVKWTPELVLLALDEAGLFPLRKAQNTRSNMGKTANLALADALNKVHAQESKKPVKEL